MLHGIDPTGEPMVLKGSCGNSGTWGAAYGGEGGGVTFFSEPNSLVQKCAQQLRPGQLVLRTQGIACNVHSVG